MNLTDRNRLERLLKDIDAGFIPKDLILSASVKTRDGENLVLTPDEYEDLILTEAENFRLDPDIESNIIEMKMLLDLERINAILKKYTAELDRLFK